MGETIKRTIRLNFDEEEDYLMGFLNGEKVSTPFIEYAIDITNMPNQQVIAVCNKLLQQGFPDAHFVNVSMSFDEDGFEEFHEKRFMRTDVNNMMKFTIQAMKDGE